MNILLQVFQIDLFREVLELPNRLKFPAPDQEQIRLNDSKDG